VGCLPTHEPFDWIDCHRGAFKFQNMLVVTVFTRLSAAALFKFSELQMRGSFGGGAQSGAALFKKSFIYVFVTKCHHFDGGKFYTVYKLQNINVTVLFMIRVQLLHRNHCWICLLDIRRRKFVALKGIRLSAAFENN
jgi:hypothetical protein